MYARCAHIGIFRPPPRQCKDRDISDTRRQTLIFRLGRCPRMFALLHRGGLAEAVGHLAYVSGIEANAEIPNLYASFVATFFRHLSLGSCDKHWTITETRKREHAKFFACSRLFASVVSPLGGAQLNFSFARDWLFPFVLMSLFSSRKSRETGSTDENRN